MCRSVIKIWWYFWLASIIDLLACTEDDCGALVLIRITLDLAHLLETVSRLVGININTSVSGAGLCIFV